MNFVKDLFDEIVEALQRNGGAIVEALGETGYMLGFSLLAAVLIGLPVGVTIFVTRPGGVRPMPWLFQLSNLYVTVVRSFPFLLFVVFLIPLTRAVYGTSFGTAAATFPMCFVAVALYARLAEQILLEIPQGILQAARSMGASTLQTVWMYLVVESRSGLVYALTSAAISLISYSTVLGVVGGGGLGDFAMRYGYQEYDYVLMYTTVIIVVVLVQLMQVGGHRLSKALDRR